jgi:hypothetical protein
MAGRIGREQPMTEHILARSGTAPLAFVGDVIAEANSRRDGKRHPAKQWYSAAIYRTAAGYVVAAEYHTEWPHERGYRWAEAVPTAAAAATWLQEIEHLEPVAGFPEGKQFEGKQARLEDSLTDQWEWLVGEVLAQAGAEFAEEA